MKRSIPPATITVIMSLILTLSAPIAIADKTESKDDYPLIKGTDGNDNFIMQAGTQEYIGGLGADSYIYNSLPDLGNSPDIIFDFRPEEGDQIILK